MQNSSANSNAFKFGLYGSLGVGIGLLAWGAFQSLATTITYVVTALFLAFGLEPAVAFLIRRKIPRAWSVLIIILLFLGAAAGVLLMIIPVVVQQISNLISSMVSLFKSPEFNDWVLSTEASLQNIFPDIQLQELFAQLVSWLQDPAHLGNIGSGVLNIGIGLINTSFGIFMVLIMTIYFLASLPTIRKNMVRLVPASRRERVTYIGDQMINSVGYFVSGLIAQSAISGSLSFILMTIIQAPFPALLAMISFFGSMIPMVGPMAAAATNVLILYLTGGGDIWPALIAGIWFLIYMQIEAYFVSPRIMGKAVQLPAILILISFLVGAALMGVLGALIAIPVGASILILINQVYIPKQDVS